VSKVSSYISPVDPDERAYWLQVNINNGHDLFRGPSSIEEAYFFTAPDTAPALLAPPPVVIRPTRPSGWWPVAWVVGLVVLAAAVAGAVT
jgi:hypothetical protein